MPLGNISEHIVSSNFFLVLSTCIHCVTVLFVHHAAFNYTCVTSSTGLSVYHEADLGYISLSVDEFLYYAPTQLYVSLTRCSNIWRRKHTEAGVSVMTERFVPA